MSFNKKFLPPLEKFLEIKNSYPNDSEFLDRYIGKYDCLVGSRESIDYLKELEEKSRKCIPLQN
jgi:hypothetical protein